MTQGLFDSQIDSCSRPGIVHDDGMNILCLDGHARSS